MRSPGALTLWQAEWCPHSHRVRLRLTELGVDFTARQVPVAQRDRDALEQATGTRSIPVLVAGDEVLDGDDAIIEWLDARCPEPPDAGAHAAKMVEEWPLWQQLHGR